MALLKLEVKLKAKLPMELEVLHDEEKDLKEEILSVLEEKGYSDIEIEEYKLI